MPSLGHMVHMPSHIDVRRGRWQQAAAANRKAIEADRRYRERVPEQGFYRIYMAHNHHMLAYSYMMEGQGERAIAAIGELVAGIPPDFARESAAFIDGYMAMPLEVLMRFGRWEEILAAPEPAEYHPIARALRHGARGVAYAAQGKTAEARAEQQLFAAARERVSAEAFFGNNPAAAILDVAEHLLAGEILFREGERDGGLAELRLAVAAEDRLRYDEPPDWIQPVRHALGAALLEAGQAAEAEAVYREDLRRLPDNGWSLFGLARSLRMQGREGEAARAEADFKQAWKRADVKLRSSCFCQPGV
jgi:tetratricopeptide (TPR) repeat protein